jgi:acyl carrier protein
MNQEEIHRALIETLGEIAPEADVARLQADRPLRDQLDIDSYDFLHWMIALNERLGVEIPEADYPKLVTLDGAIDYLTPVANASQT